MSRQEGFTMIELVVVIAILGILAAVALPRFMDANKDAHRAAVAGTAGALGASVALVRGQWEVNKSKGLGANPQVGFGKNNVFVNAEGWPIGLSSAVSCTEIWQNVLQASAPTVAASNAAYVPTFASSVCTYTYQGDGKNDLIRYDTSTGEVTFTFVE
ncbi:hypothetical protein PK34_19630 [Stutzerimonas stutzeri]|uniref:type II secretion system protein n=1 Tax=Stutzerimonas stutzeri TaxID=316 RepID=UPI000627E3AC|nr:hypothetical protein PK34_19630 [Stutzerimonas stutzeri]